MGAPSAAFWQPFLHAVPPAFRGYGSRLPLTNAPTAPFTAFPTPDPHDVAWGALGVAAFHHLPHGLERAQAQAYEDVADLRVIRVQLNGHFAHPLAVEDITHALLQQRLPLHAAVLHVAGEAVEGLDIPARRRLAAALADAGARTVLLPIDDAVRAHWRQPTLHAPDVDVFDEVVIFDAAHVPAPPRRLIAHAAIGGCVGGDEASLRLVLDALGERRLAPGSELHLVPEATLPESLATMGLPSGVSWRLREALPAGPLAANSTCLSQGGPVMTTRAILDGITEGAK